MRELNRNKNQIITNTMSVDMDKLEIRVGNDMKEYMQKASVEFSLFLWSSHCDTACAFGTHSDRLNIVAHTYA
jgi:hypothetical protein